MTRLSWGVFPRGVLNSHSQRIAGVGSSEGSTELNVQSGWHLSYVSVFSVLLQVLLYQNSMDFLHRLQEAGVASPVKDYIRKGHSIICPTLSIETAIRSIHTQGSGKIGSASYWAGARPHCDRRYCCRPLGEYTLLQAFL